MGKGNFINNKIMLIVFVFSMIISTYNLLGGDEKKITQKIESMHGEVVHIQKSSLGRREQRRYYIFEYKINNEVRTGSVIFGVWWGTTWNFDN